MWSFHATLTTDHGDDLHIAALETGMSIKTSIPNQNMGEEYQAHRPLHFVDVLKQDSRVEALDV